MSNEERNELKQLIQGQKSGQEARVEAKYDIIDLKLDAINNHLETLNGRVVKQEKVTGDLLIIEAKSYQKHKDEENTRAMTCPKEDEINDLKQNQTTNTAMKRYNAKLFITSTTILGLVLTIFGLWIKLGGQ